MAEPLPPPDSSSDTPPPAEGDHLRPGPHPDEDGFLPESMLLENALWFCQLRWIAIVILLGFGVLDLIGDFAGRLGFRAGQAWPFAAGGVLILGNIVFWGHARWAKHAGRLRAAGKNLWGQILVDLLVVTAMVHFVGSLETYAPFAYLFHIVLACIFFSRRQSLAVTLIACVFYSACITAEQTGLLAPAGILADTSTQRQMGAMTGAPTMNFLSALVIWLVVWYLASQLSAMVQARDRELVAANRRLVAVQQERAKHMLRTTHELKAPFAAIHANTQLLLKGLCGALPDQAVDVVNRIAARSRRLASEIQEMLQLANLRSTGRPRLQWARIDVGEVLTWCIGQVQALADEREIVFENDIHPAWTVGVDDHLKMLFINLLANAVVYSHQGGWVRVKCRAGPKDQPAVIIQDNGIGIPKEKLPRIFDEYYRTDEAVRHNKESSGLGLAIVRHVAQTHAIRMRVESEPGNGTTFELLLPRATPTAPAEADMKET